MSKISKLPDFFFDPKQYTTALLNIRRCYAEGLKGNDMIEELRAYQQTCKDDAQKELLENLILAVCEFAPDEVKETYAKFYDMVHSRNFPLSPSASFHLLKEGFKRDHGFKWLDDYKESVSSESKINRDFDEPYYWMVVPPKQKENVITLCKKAELYCVVEKDLTVNLIVMVNDIGRFTINEMCYEYENAGQTPTYTSVTNDEWFYSPVYKVRIAKKVLEYCLRKVGYPYVHIKMRVIYTSPSIKLVNMDQILNQTKDWEGVDVTMVRSLDPKKGFMLECPYKNLLFAAKDFYERELVRMLYASLSATSMIFSELYETDCLIYSSEGELDTYSFMFQSSPKEEE